MEKIDNQREAKILESLKATIEKIKTEKAQGEGALKSILDRLIKEFGVKDLDGAYALLEQMKADIEIATEQRAELLKEAEEKLSKYRI